MNTESHTSPSKKREHGTALSYVVGFILSLIFTIIPYYMVVNESAAGNPLLITILGFAVLQMFIQIFFFLHLGRGPKPLYNVIFFFATAGTIVVVIGASLFIMDNLYRNMAPGEVILRQAQKEGIAQVGGQATGACTENKRNHTVSINKGVVTPSYVEARRCDTLTFINNDNQAREMAFGAHPNHDSYGGETEVALPKGKPETITLNQAGEYMFHDHLDPATSGSFSVAEQ
jgi:cytochrome o ubiquinol oxidase operon protein cyoD